MVDDKCLSINAGLGYISKLQIVSQTDSITKLPFMQTEIMFRKKNGSAVSHDDAPFPSARSTHRFSFVGN